MGSQGQDIEKGRYGQTAPIEETGIRFFVGRVLSVNADQGVLSIGTGKGGTNQAEITASYMPLSDSSYGASAFPVVTAGTSMLCATLSSASHSDITYALVPVNDSIDGGYNSSLQRACMYTAEDISSAIMNSSDVEMQRKLHGMAIDGLLYSHAHGMPFGALPGDYYIMDKETGCGLAVSKLQAVLKGNAISSVLVSAHNGKTQVSGKSVFIDTLTGEDVHGSGFYVRNTGLSANESLGELTGTRPVLRKEDNGGRSRLALDVDAVPFYRIQHAEGLPVGGAQDMVLGSLDESVQEHTGSTEPPVMSVRRSGLDGSLQSMSAQGLTLLKSPVIRGIHQIGYGSRPLKSNRPDGKLEFDDLREAYEAPAATTQPQSEDELDIDDETVNAALLKMVDGLLDGEYSDAFKRIMASRGFGTSTEKGTIKARITGSGSSAGKTTGATDKQFYDLPQYIELENPVTGERRKYYDSTSFISQEPDGSICLKDGYGSEIRMCRGNIYLSPALDLLVRTGRDFSVMAGRHQSYDSLDTCTINSTRSSVYVRGWKDLKMDGGWDGSVTLQCHSIFTSSNDLNAPKGGLSIVSNGDATFTAGGNMWIGLSRVSAVTGLGYDAKSAETPVLGNENGNLIIGGGKNLFVYGKNTTLSSLNFIGQFDKSCVAVTDNRISLLSTGGIRVNDNITVSPNITLTCQVPEDAGKGELKSVRRTFPGGANGSEGELKDSLKLNLSSDISVNGNLTLNAWKRSSDDNPGNDAHGRPIQGGNLTVAGAADVGGKVSAHNITAQAVTASSQLSTQYFRATGPAFMNTIYLKDVYTNILHVRGGILGYGDHYQLTGTAKITIDNKTYTGAVVVGNREPSSWNNANEAFPELADPSLSRAVLSVNGLLYDNPCTSGVVAASKQDKGYFNSKYILARGFRFPLSYGVQWDVLPGMAWEQAATGVNRTVNEAPGYAEGGAVTLTAQYPGMDVLQNLKVSALENGKLVTKDFLAVQTNSKAPSPRNTGAGKLITTPLQDVNLSGKIE